MDVRSCISGKTQAIVSKFLNPILIRPASTEASPTSSLYPFYNQSPPSMQRNRARPDPVSCQSCRSKKLKCSRVQPCTNCTARGIPCHFLVRPHGQMIAPSTAQSNEELLRRIEKLESIVLKQDGSTGTRSCDVANESFVPSQRLVESTSERPSGPECVQNGDQDSRLLENVGMREDTLVGYTITSRIAFSLMLHSFLYCLDAWDSKLQAEMISSSRLQSGTNIPARLLSHSQLTT